MCSADGSNTIGANQRVRYHSADCCQISSNKITGATWRSETSHLAFSAGWFSATPLGKGRGLLLFCIGRIGDGSEQSMYMLYRFTKTITNLKYMVKFKY